MNKLPTLYKMSSTGKVREWTISWFIKDGINRYSITHGQHNGKLQTNETEVLAGKNIGKSNETTAQEQCEAEATSLWTKKKDREGYTEDIPSEKPLRPMLAKTFDDQSHHIVYPCYTQAKLDGIRCLAKIEDGKVVLLSRKNKEFTSLPHINKELSKLDNIILDGELYNHDISFQEITSIVRKDDATEDSVKVSFYVYDIVDENASYKERHDNLFKLLVSQNHFQHIHFVDTYPCKSESDVIKDHKEMINDGYEGVMVRNGHGKYEINKRSKHLQKLKSFLDKEYKIVDVVEGKGKFKNMGIFVCTTEKGQIFNVTPACTEQGKRDILKNKNKHIGEELTVKFFEYTDDGVPRFPVGIVRNYE